MEGQRTLQSQWLTRYGWWVPGRQADCPLAPPQHQIWIYSRLGQCAMASYTFIILYIYRVIMEIWDCRRVRLNAANCASRKEVRGFLFCANKVIKVSSKLLVSNSLSLHFNCQACITAPKIDKKVCVALVEQFLGRLKTSDFACNCCTKKNSQYKNW